VPFDFLRRRKPEAGKDPATSADPTPARRSERGIPFDGLTEEWRIVGEMDIKGRLSDALNKREAIQISNVKWAPVDGSAGLSEASGLKEVDPYDLIIVLAGEATLPPLSEAERTAYKVHKIAYDVALEVPPFRVIGTVHLYPGSEPERLLDRATEMFLPVVDAVAYLGDQAIVDEMDAVLVNRFYLRGIEQIDKRTGEKPQKLPGAPLGGISWQDKAR
jgi:hypothetical protein